jgi:hypothetical protein
MSLSASTKLTQGQSSMINNTKLSGSIRLLMEDGKSYEEAIAETLENEGWEMIETESSLEFYNNKTKQVAAATPYGNIYVPTTQDPFMVNAFRVVQHGHMYYSVEPNEWSSVYDSRNGNRLLKNIVYREKRNMKRNKKKNGLNYSSYQ